MILTVQTNNIDALIESGYFLNICTSYSFNEIKEINILCKSHQKSRLMSNRPKTGHGYRLMASYQRLASKVNLSYPDSSTNIDESNFLSDKTNKFVA